MKRFIPILGSLFLLGIFATDLQAAHIIGGEITYQCLGDGDTPNTRKYQFTMKIYRDCQGGGAPFDSGSNAPFNATVTIYRSGLTTPFRVLELGAPQINRIDPSTNPCLIVPPNVCVEEGIYTIPEIDLPISDESYHVVYQRCCRNNSINNLVNPGESGATYTMELTPRAQETCNNSPDFNDFPPIVICAGEPFSFDHSATDAEGDQLVYEFCSPFLGGGPNTFDAEAIDGVAPNPDAAPPYNPVLFQQPTYASNRPLGAAANMRIDPNTGLITAQPNVLGQFVVGVCVSEFRNGELLSTVRRDFQFNVTNCEPTVVADMEADSILSEKRFLFLSCGDRSVSINNTSFQQQFINEYAWEFDIEGDTVRSADRSPTFEFPDLGEYEGRMILNPETNCGDTAEVVVHIFPEINADFEYEYDTCVAGPIAFTDLSTTGSAGITDWQWTFESGGESTQRNPDYAYETPGNKSVLLQVRDVNGCTDQVQEPVTYFPVPPVLIVAPSTFDGCIPANIFFDNLSTPIDDTYDITWDFGDGGTSGAISPSHTYEEPGLYTISLDVVSPIGCQIDTTFRDWIKVEPSPTADFTFTPEEPSIFDPVVNFESLSQFAEKHFWDFNGRGTSMLENPSFTFPDSGRQVIQLIVTHESGCQDSIQRIVDITPEIRYFVPNAFTPNNDGRNDFFRGTGVMEGVTNFSFTVWNRYGELIFTATDPEEGWNGRSEKDGKPAPNGVYVYVVTFNGPRGEREERKGTFTLIR